MKLIWLLISCCVCFSTLPGQNLKEELDAILTPRFSEEAPGIAFLVQKGDDVVYQRCIGWADINTKKPIDEHTLFNLGSLSKTMVAYGILKMVSEGRLELESTLYDHFPDFKHDSIARQVQLHHLLTHTSGLPDLRDFDDPATLWSKDREAWEPIKAAEKLKFTPGSRSLYCNVAFNALALIIEQETGAPWQQYIVEKILRPSGMTQSVITDGPYPESGVAHAYQKDSTGQYVEYDYGEFPAFAASGNGGVWSNLRELALYEKAIQNATFLSPEWIQFSRTIYYPENWKARYEPFYGRCWFMDESSLVWVPQQLGTSVVHHTGGQGGFLTMYVALPEEDILLVGLINNNSSEFWDIFLEALFILKSYDYLRE